MPFLRLEDLSKRFGATQAVDHVSLALERGEILALLGPSGSGKTTTLRLLAGFEVPDSGRVLVEQDDVTAVAPVARRFGMVFQHYALFPHLDVGQNVAFGLESLGVCGEELSQRVSRALTLVDLAGFERRRIGQLSGGQQQRVDEPLSNLDPALRERTRREIRELIRRVGITSVFVTHEQEEAFDLGDRVAVLRGGRLEQVGTPEDLYAAPATEFVAEFVGRSSSIPVTVLGPGDRGLRVAVEGVEWQLTETASSSAPAGPAMMVVRPEALRLLDPAPGTINGVITQRRFTGSASLYTVVTDGGASLEVSGPPRAVSPGQRTGILPSRRAGGGIHLFSAREK
jgi:ABC-type Fe3+/spermidine/putrescine transport system ATPase subunit